MVIKKDLNKISSKFYNILHIKQFMKNKPVLGSTIIKEDLASYKEGDKLEYGGCNYIITKKEFYKDHSITYFVKKEVIK